MNTLEKLEILSNTALCALKELTFLLRAALREALNKNFVPMHLNSAI